MVIQFSLGDGDVGEELTEDSRLYSRIDQLK